jgi:ActR/RegA family two-component response regulator
VHPLHRIVDVIHWLRAHRVLTTLNVTSWFGSAILIAQGAAQTAVNGVAAGGGWVTLGGIATAFLPLLFAYLNKKLELESRTKELERLLADAHGRIEDLESRTKAIPANTASAAASQGVAAGAAELAMSGEGLGRLLLVEDDDHNSRYLANKLTLRGYNVWHAPTVKAAIAALEESVEPFRAIVLDLTLPDGDGAAVVDYCREHGRRARIAVVTGTTDRDRAWGLLERGVVAVLPKPLHGMESLYAAIEGEPEGG